MNLLVMLSFFVIGLFVGSFLNVVILRWRSDKSIITGRSVCTHTGKILPWYDLIPVISFVILLGKSRFSGKPISIQYPLVEIITGVLFAGVYWKLFGAGSVFVLSFVSVFALVSHLIVISLLIIIAFYDLRTKIIPNPLVYSFIIVSGVILFSQNGLALFSQVGLLDLFAGAILWFPFAFLWFISRGAWMGYGDAKLAWGIGWFLGLLAGVSAIVLSFWIGAIIALLLVGLKNVLEKYLSFLPESFTIKSEVPFAPFLIIGTLLVFFFDLNVFLFF